MIEILCRYCHRLMFHHDGDPRGMKLMAKNVTLPDGTKPQPADPIPTCDCYGRKNAGHGPVSKHLYVGAEIEVAV